MLHTKCESSRNSLDRSSEVTPPTQIRDSFDQVDDADAVFGRPTRRGLYVNRFTFECQLLTINSPGKVESELYRLNIHVMKRALKMKRIYGSEKW
jgi:hypothetical protein